VSRIVHLSWEYPPIVYGGLGRHVDALASAQVAAGHEVTVVTQEPAEPAPDPDNGVRVVRVAPDGPFPYHLPSLLTWVGTLDHRIGSAAQALANADIVHAHDWVVGRAGSRAARTLGAPLVATIHATEAGRHSGWLPDPVSASVHLVEQWLVDEADELIVCSQSMAEEVRRAHGGHAERRHVVPNGIDTTFYPTVSQVPEELLTTTPRLTFVGRIEWEKGVFVAVDAMPAIVAEYAGAQLRIVGTGGQSAAVAARIDALGLSGHVTMFGHVDERRLRQLYASSDLLVAPSSYEPFGIVALEGAAMGIPLIVGDTGGLAEFVTDDRGRRVRPNDPQHLAQQILAALHDRQGTAARRDAAIAALTDYSWPRIAQLTDAVYAHARRTQHPARRGPFTPGRVW
jgi:glycogen synthase